MLCVAEMETFRPEPFETERLKLREPRREDAEAIYRAYATDPEVARYMTWRPHTSIDETRTFIEGRIQSWNAARDWDWVIELKETGAVVGCIGVRRDQHEITLGYVLARAHWGKGLMPEAVKAVAFRAFDDVAIHRVCARCDVDNRPSARVMEKVGMRREGLLRRSLLHPNQSAEPRDGYLYAVARGDRLEPIKSFSKHSAEVRWTRGDALFIDNRYSREHRWHFDGGAEILAAASPHIVPPALTNPAAVDPEEALVAALSSCHMLWFLSLAAGQGFSVDRYSDEAFGEMSAEGRGRLAFQRVVLRPKVEFIGAKQPTADELETLHHEAHRRCFLARSVRFPVELSG